MNANTPDQLALELPRLIERMHRRYLDVVRLALESRAADDISPVQFMMLQTINAIAADGDVSVRDLVARGYYLGSNASYNLKQLVEGGYVDRSAAARDRRTARLKLTARGAELCAAIRTHDAGIFATLKTEENGAEKGADIIATHRLLRALEHRWSETVRDANSLEEL